MSRSVAAVLVTALGGRARPCASEGRVRFRLYVPDPAARTTRTSAGDLTPYAAELLADEMRGARSDCRVELFVHAGTAASFAASVRRHLERLRRRGIEVRVSE